MAVTNAVGALFAARLEANYKRRAVWRGVSEDHSAETPFGNALSINRDATDYSSAVQDYTPGTAIPNQTRVDTGRGLLSLDKDKVLNLYVDDKESVQVRPSLVDSVTFEVARELALQVNDDIRAAAGDGLTGDSKLDDISVGSAYANVANATGGELYFASMRDATIRADELGWPEMGRVLVCHPAVKGAFNASLYDKGIPFTSVATGDRSIVDAQVMKLFGWEILVDPGIPKTGTDGYRLHFLTRGMGLAFAEQYNRAEILRAQDKVGDIIRRVITYGAKRTSGDKVMIADVKAA